MQKRNVLNAPRLLELKKNRRKSFFKKIFISIFTLVVIFISLAYLSRLPSLNINDIEIVGNKIVDSSLIKTVAEQQLSEKFLYFFPKTNILYYPQNSLKNNLEQNFQRLENIKLSIKDNRTLLISLSERTAKYTWCGTISPTNTEQTSTDKSSEKCYFMDENGYVFDTAPYFSGNVYFKFYGLAGVNPDNAPGSYYSKQNFQRLVSFKDTLINIGLNPVELYIADNNEDATIFLSNIAPSKNEPKIIVKINDNLEKVAENLEAALTTEPLKSKFKNSYSSLEYIDLRFGNRVYDKFTSSPQK